MPDDRRILEQLMLRRSTHESTQCCYFLAVEFDAIPTIKRATVRLTPREAAHRYDVAGPCSGFAAPTIHGTSDLAVMSALRRLHSARESER
jgi:hypothetical protein